MGRDEVQQQAQLELLTESAKRKVAPTKRNCGLSPNPHPGTVPGEAGRPAWPRHVDRRAESAGPATPAPP